MGRWRSWASGWASLARHDDIEAYRALGRWQRFRLDCATALDALGTSAFRGGALILGAAVLAAQIAVWELGLTGWRRDGLQALPFLVAAPALAALRRRLIAKRLAARLCEHHHGSGPRPAAQ